MGQCLTNNFIHQEFTMGAFVLGILVGWLAEWLFFTFWIKGRSTGKFADCTTLKNEVSRKNKEISDLQDELESAKKAALKVTAAKASTADSIDEGKSESKTTTKASDTSKDKTTSQKTATKKKPSEKKTPARKPAVKKVTEEKTKAKKVVAKKATNKKPSVKKPTAKKSKTGDDLTKLSGIGPSMNSKLSELGITSYKKLADMDDDILRDMLEASGARLNNNKEAMDTWNEQAALADKGDFEGLKKLQDSLKG